MLRLLLAVSCFFPPAGRRNGWRRSPPATSRAPVMIVGSRGNFCTGTMVARDLVLTAAHCVPAGADYKLVQLDAQRQPKLRDTGRIERHPQFSMQAFLNHRATADVALIKLAAPLPNRAGRRSAEESDVAPGDRFTVTGYGLTERGNGKSGGTLRIAHLVATGKPGNLQIRLMDPATRNERAGLGACTGDFGAPVFQDFGGRGDHRGGELVDRTEQRGRLRRAYRGHAAVALPKLDRGYGAENGIAACAP